MPRLFVQKPSCLMQRRIRRGLAQAKKGLGRPVDNVFDELDR
jgi:hypothetical protein